MSIYVILWLIIIAFSFLEVNCKRLSLGELRFEVRKLSFFAIASYVMAIGVFRNEFLGVDTLNYKRHYLRYGNMSMEQFLRTNMADKGFYLFGRLVYNITDDFWMLKVILYIITFLLVCYMIYKYSSYPAVSFMGYFGFAFMGMNFCLLRQAIAIGIAFYSVRFVKEKKPILFVLTVLLSATMHSTAIAFLLVYPVATGLIQKILYKIRWIMIVAALLFVRYGLPFAYQHYRMDYSLSAVSGQGINLLIVYIIIVTGIGYLIWNENDEDMKSEYSILFLIIPAQIIALFFSLFTRMTSYFTVMLTLVVPRLLMMERTKKMKNFVLFAYCFGCTIMFFYSLYSNNMRIVPYVSIFSEID